jgi:hypothetical protein
MRQVALPSVGTLPPRRLPRPAPPPSGAGLSLAAGVPPPTVLLLVVSASQLHPGMTPDLIVERLRSYALGVCGVVTSVSPGATLANLRAHFAPLRPTSCVHADRCRLTPWRFGYRLYCVSGGRTGISPCLTRSPKRPMSLPSCSRHCRP